MSDPLRTDAAQGADAAVIADRDARIEQLLLAGLDHYFGGDFEHAINVWSRVVFLDRQHSRARAYIDRARGAIAERQRESEELLHRGVDAFNRGDTSEARTLINQAVEQVGPTDLALVFLERLNRLEPGMPGVEGVKPSLPADTRRRPVVDTPQVRRTSLWFAGGTAVVAGAVALLLAGTGFGMWFADRPSTRIEAMPEGVAALPVARASETALAQARRLSADGHLREALRALRTVSAADPMRPEADSIESEIQRRLLEDTVTGWSR